MSHPIHTAPGGATNAAAKASNFPESNLTDEPALSLLHRCVKPGDRAVIAGAGIEEYAQEFSRLVGPGGMVWAFEPVPEKFVALNVLSNQLGNVYPYQCALGNHDGLAYYSVSGSRGLDGTHRARFSDGHGRNDFLVKVERLDDCVHERIHYIRIDVAGDEIGVLEGAAKVIRKYHPACLLELLPSTGREIFRLLHAAAYEGFTFHSHLRSAPEYLNGECTSYFFLPPTRAGAIRHNCAAAA